MTKTLFSLLTMFAAAVAPMTCLGAEPVPAPARQADAVPAAAAPSQPDAAMPAPPKPAGPSAEQETSLVDTVRALSQFLTEDEVQMVYDYLWDSSIAALRGSDEEITLPPDLVFKLAILQKRIEKEGGYYLQGLALKMEKDLARWRESLNNPPPPPAYQLPSERNAPAQP